MSNTCLYLKKSWNLQGMALPQNKSHIWYLRKDLTLQSTFSITVAGTKLAQYHENTSISASLDCLKWSLAESVKIFKKQRNLTQPGNYSRASDLTIASLHAVVNKPCKDDFKKEIELSVTL